MNDRMRDEAIAWQVFYRTSDAVLGGSDHPSVQQIADASIDFVDQLEADGRLSLYVFDQRRAAAEQEQ